MKKTLLLLATMQIALVHDCAAATKEVVWEPLEKQEVEPDTLYLLDVDAELRLKPGEGGLIAGNAAGGDQFGDKVVVTDGKFRKGLKSIARNYGYMWMPSNGLIAPDEFTVEYWLKSDKPWAEWQDMIPLIIWGEHGAVRLECTLHDGRLNLYFRHNQSVNGLVGVHLFCDLKQNPIAANEWHHLAYTFKAGVLRFYLDGKPIGESPRLEPPRIWSDAARGDGLSILGGYGRGSNGLSISDLRISRRARTPGEKTTVDNDNVLTVQVDQSAMQNQTVQQNLLGGLHTLWGPETEAMAKGAIKVLRTDKLLTVTPIKAGAPDEKHPGKGISGQYSYDWQVVDRTFNYYKRLGIMPYISIDSTPKMLGGKTPPFEGERLETQRSYASGFTPEVPNDMEAFGTMVRDLIHHVVKEEKHHVPYWSVWNEPDGPGFFSTKLDDYLRLYEVCAKAVRAVAPNLQVGGPETGEYNAKWVEGLIKHCAEKKLPLDFISWHYYLGELTEFSHAKNQVAAWSKQYGLAGVPGLINGEWCWQAHNVAGTGYLPWRGYRYHINDWHAAFTAVSLVEMQRAGVLLSIYTNPVAKADGTGWNASGLMSHEHPWANLNVFRMWSRLAPNIIKTEFDGLPNIWTQASCNGSGRITILLSHLRYRKDVSPEVTIKLAGLRNSNQSLMVTQYVVDDRHSNAHDAGKEHAELETIPPPKVQDSQMQITMRPRSVHLLVLDPIAK